MHAEIFFDPAEEPYIRLLPIETRGRNETILALKHRPQNGQDREGQPCLAEDDGCEALARRQPGIDAATLAGASLRAHGLRLSRGGSGEEPDHRRCDGKGLHGAVLGVQ